MYASGKLSILLVEDHTDSASAISRLLELRGYAVTTADTFAGAVESAHLHHYDLLVTDIGLPDRSGLELLKELRAIYSIEGIVLSGYGMKKDVIAATDAGYARHILKPCTMESLDAAILQSMTIG